MLTGLPVLIYIASMCIAYATWRLVNVLWNYEGRAAQMWAAVCYVLAIVFGLISITRSL